jgi:hypothetical protein
MGGYQQQQQQYMGQQQHGGPQGEVTAETLLQQLVWQMSAE